MGGATGIKVRTGSYSSTILSSTNYLKFHGITDFTHYPSNSEYEISSALGNLNQRALHKETGNDRCFFAK